MNNCVQCGDQLKFVIDVQSKQVPVCHKKSCPNFGLLQLGVRVMADMIHMDESGEGKVYMSNHDKND